MTDATSTGAVPSGKAHSSLLELDARTKRRNAAETRFKFFGMAAVTLGLLALVMLLASILSNGLSSFRQTFVTFPLTVSQEQFEAAEGALMKTSAYNGLIGEAMLEALEGAGLTERDLSDGDITAIMSKNAAGDLRAFLRATPEALGVEREYVFLANGRIDGYFKGRVTLATAELDSNVTPEQLLFADRMVEAGLMETKFNWGFLTEPDASGQRPEAAGLGVAIMGSFFMMLVVLFLALPIGVAASIYLEEFAPKNRITDIIEVNISNLAAVPSIVFGILGLAIFINFAGLPQSAPIVGGLVLTLMTLPTIIISTRASLKAVPPSIRDAALGIGASKMQSVFHHVLPLAAPGILTGTIIGLAQALGETAPLLLIGMVAFIGEYPSMSPEGFFDPASALPVQVYNWTQRADPSFVERASGAIIVLLIFLVIMNTIAIILRRRFERRW